MKEPILSQATLMNLIEKTSIPKEDKEKFRELIPYLAREARIELLKGILDLLQLEEEKKSRIELLKKVK